MESRFNIGEGRFVALAGGLALLVTATVVSPAAGKPPKAVCGNSIAELGEACDTSDLRSNTCQSLGFAAGTLACTVGCTLETSGCTFVRFVDNGDGTVTDNQTGLQWEKKDALDGVMDFSNPHDVDNSYNWSIVASCTYVGCPNGTGYTDFLGRLNYCVNDGTTIINPGFAGHCDWRLPTIDELKTIVDMNAPGCGNGPCIDAILGPTGTVYGSSTTSSALAYGNYAWVVHFGSGAAGHRAKGSHTFRFRAVRGGF